MTPLQLVKLTHTAIWAIFAAAIVAIPFCARAGSVGWTLALIGLVLAEIFVLAANHWTCPLTTLASRYTDDRRHNFDIYLPLWLAKYNKQIFGTLFVAGLLIAAGYFAQALQS